VRRSFRPALAKLHAVNSHSLVDARRGHGIPPRPHHLVSRHACCSCCNYRTNCAVLRLIYCPSTHTRSYQLSYAHGPLLTLYDNTSAIDVWLLWQSCPWVRSNPTHQLTDPTRPNPIQLTMELTV